MTRSDLEDSKLTIEDLEDSGILQAISALDSKEKRAQIFETNYLILYIVIAFNLSLSAYLLLDSSTFIYQAPVTYEVKNVQRLTRIDDVSLEQIERGVYDFARRYVKARYPKNQLDLDNYYEFIINHSSSHIADDFQGRLQDSEKIKQDLGYGLTTSIYTRSFDDLKIQKLEGVSEWAIAIPVRKVIRGTGSGDERFDAVINMNISYNLPTLKNDGFTVLNYEEIVITSDITSEKVNVIGN